jgi:hypothetical protein
LTELHAQLLTALKALGGRGTVGDVAARAGLPSHAVEHDMLAALTHVGGHVAVDEHGNLVFSIERSRPLPSFRPPLLARFFAALWSAFRVAFFAALTLTLVIYFSVYILLIIAVMVAGIAAAAKGSDCDCDCDCKAPDCGQNLDCCGACCDANTCHGCNQGGDCCYARLCGKKRPERLVTRQALRHHQEQARAARHLLREERAKARARRLRDALRALVPLRGKAYTYPLEPEVVTGKPPFFRAVRDYVFGPPRLPPDPTAQLKNLLGFVRDHAGRATATDAALVTGLPIDQADRLLLELAARHDGDVEATEEGAVVYRFDRFMVSAAADLDALAWIAQRPEGHRVSVSEFAHEQKITAAEALARLETLAQIAGAKVEHGESSAFVFDAAARRRLDGVASQHGVLRDFFYCWERLEKAPAIIGVAEGHRGWIVGFNTLNLVVSAFLTFFYGAGNRLVGEVFDAVPPALELWALGVVPLLLSAGFFLIPLARAIVEGVRNGARRRRNTRRIVLLAVAHGLATRSLVGTAFVRQTLGADAGADGAIEKVLLAVARDLEGEIVIGGPVDEATGAAATRIDFARAHRELKAVERERAELDPSAFALKPIAYDTASDRV